MRKQEVESYLREPVEKLSVFQLREICWYFNSHQQGNRHDLELRVREVVSMFLVYERLEQK